ncbi:hypothetical protein AJ80_07963 [Polytolypa hystricis UAMH7299]|uniref:Uncharacterized protein n=1 Tax=Polytolypa hystricis (strain UAMH7299) TaxID=1447883 RepID=A0A2B7XGL0_POLH7|nr:hypothetical protein AJ80_07963 [Polytolypa hystricis UAMH7299]
MRIANESPSNGRYWFVSNGRSDVKIYEASGSRSAVTIACQNNSDRNSIYVQSPATISPDTSTLPTSGRSQIGQISATSTAPTMSLTRMVTPSIPTPASNSSPSVTLTPSNPSKNLAWVSGPIVGGLIAFGLIVAAAIFYLHKRKAGKSMATNPEILPLVQEQQELKAELAAPLHVPPAELDNSERPEAIYELPDNTTDR